MKRSFVASSILLGIVLSVALFARPLPVYSQDSSENLARGAALYDNWFALLKTSPPSGNMPIWSRQTENSASGPDTWRCVTCHGWDYQGASGAYRSGAHFTGFPALLPLMKDKSTRDIVDFLSGKADPAHDFSPYLSQEDMNDLAFFLKKGLIDDNAMIDPVSFQVIGGDAGRGGQLYRDGCASCHGQDGAKITFRLEGRNASLGDLANLNPWMFLHKSRFGTPGTDMPVGYDLGWTPQEGRDTLLYTQSLSRIMTVPEQSSVLQTNREPPVKVGGPATNIFTGILTALSAMSVSLGFSIMSGAAMVGVLLLVVWLLRGRR